MGQPADELSLEYLENLEPHQRRFRSNSGMGWVGVIVRRTPTTITIKNPRPLHAMPNGWFDYIGWDEITVTPDMVGQKVAVFVGAEVKAGRDRLSPDQRRLGESLRSHGGRWDVVHSE